MVYRILTSIASGLIFLVGIVAIAGSIAASFKLGIFLTSYFTHEAGIGVLVGLFLWFFFVITVLSYIWGPVWGSSRR